MSTLTLWCARTGETGWTARLIPLTVDGLIWASSMVLLDSARRGVRVPVLARGLLGLGIATTLAANVAHGLGNGPVGALVAAWPAVALVGSYELLMMIIRGTQTLAVAPSPQDDVSVTDPLGERAAVVFAAELAADRVPSICAIRTTLHVGQPRAQRLREHLAAAAETHGETLPPNRRSRTARRRTHARRRTRVKYAGGGLLCTDELADLVRLRTTALQTLPVAL
jgi:hypothetical protein